MVWARSLKVRPGVVLLLDLGMQHVQRRRLQTNTRFCVALVLQLASWLQHSKHILGDVVLHVGRGVLWGHLLLGPSVVSRQASRECMRIRVCCKCASVLEWNEKKNEDGRRTGPYKGRKLAT